VHLRKCGSLGKPRAALARHKRHASLRETRIRPLHRGNKRIHLKSIVPQVLTSMLGRDSKGDRAGAEVPDPINPCTMPNEAFAEVLKEADRVIWAGEPANLGLANTIRDALDLIQPAAIKKMVLLTDATSPVPGFDKEFAAFVTEMTKRGMRTSTTTEVVGWGEKPGRGRKTGTFLHFFRRRKTGKF
jgi:hypothetical protein